MAICGPLIHLIITTRMRKDKQRLFETLLYLHSAGKETKNNLYLPPLLALNLFPSHFFLSSAVIRISGLAFLTLLFHRWTSVEAGEAVLRGSLNM